MKNQQPDWAVYVGTFTRAVGGRHRPDGIYIYRMSPDTGRLTHVDTVMNTLDPAFLALAPSRRFLYAVNEVREFEGQASGMVSAFAVEPEAGRLTWLNLQPTRSSGPCYVSVDPTGRWVLAANYHGGAVNVFPVQPDGRLGAATEFIQQRGSSVVTDRQEAAHAHSIILDPTQRFAFVADLGMDKIVVYRFDAERGQLVPHDPPWVGSKPGAGPRHMAFHPNGKYMYVSNELDSTVTVLAYDAARGVFEPLQTLSSLPPEWEGENSGADIHIAPSGDFLYASNRGHDSLAIFAVGEDGTLTAAGHVSTQGHTPRNFGLSPDGNWLLAANQDSHTVVVFRVDQATGQLAPTGRVLAVPLPVCVLITPL